MKCFMICACECVDLTMPNITEVIYSYLLVDEWMLLTEQNQSTRR